MAPPFKTESASSAQASRRLSSTVRSTVLALLITKPIHAPANRTWMHVGATRTKLRTTVQPLDPVCDCLRNVSHSAPSRRTRRMAFIERLMTVLLSSPSTTPQQPELQRLRKHKQLLQQHQALIASLSVHSVCCWCRLHFPETWSLT